MVRQQTSPALDTSLIPSCEADLPPLTISDDVDHVVDLTANGVVTFVPLILEVRATGNFLEGASARNQTNNIWSEGGVKWNIPLQGATSWHFMRQAGVGNITFYFKVRGSN